MSIRSFAASITAGMAIIIPIAIAGSAMAQQSPPASDAAAEEQEEQEQRKANNRQAELAREQLERNASEEAEYQQETEQQSEDLLNRAGSLAEYDAAVKAYEKARAAHAIAVEKWQADVAACEAGDRSRCAQPAAPQ